MRVSVDDRDSKPQVMPSHSNNDGRTYYSRNTHTQDDGVKNHKERPFVPSRSPERRKAYSSDNRQSYPIDRRVASPHTARDVFGRSTNEPYIPNGGRSYAAVTLNCPRCRLVNLSSREKCEYCQARLPRGEEEALIGVGAGVGGVALGAFGAIVAGATILNAIARPP